MSQLLFGDFVKLMAGVPVLDERVEDLFTAVPFCTTENESDVGENESTFAFTVSVIFNVALVYPDADAVTVALYVPGDNPAEFIPNVFAPNPPVGSTTQLADLVKVMVGDPVFAESVEDLFAVVPSW
jgi:hypothetical protein